MLFALSVLLLLPVFLDFIRIKCYNRNKKEKKRMNEQKHFKNRIVIDPKIRFGKPCINGTRITVQDVLELVQEGISFDEIVKDYYPDIKLEDVKLCVENWNKHK